MQQRTVLLAIVAFLALPLIGLNQRGFKAQTSVRASDAWRDVHVADVLFTGIEDQRTETQPICNSIAEFNNWWNQRPNSCLHVHYGLPAVVLEIVPPTCSDDTRCFGAIVKVRARTRKWTGYTGLSYMQPNIKPGTVLKMVADWNSPNILTRDPNKSLIGAVDLGTAAYVKVLRYVPQYRVQLYVVVLTGKYRMRRGWMEIADAEGVLGQGIYGLIDPTPRPIPH